MNEDVRIPSLDTARLVLRPMQSDDAEPMTALLQDFEIIRWTSNIPWPYTVEDARRFIDTQSDDSPPRSSFVWAVVESGTGQLAGTIGLLSVERSASRADLGYWLGARYRGKGYATEAARRVIAWGFEFADLARIQATYFPGNDASANVMRKIGMRPEGVLRGYALKDGEFRDICLQAVLRRDSTWMASSEQERPNV